MAANLARNWSAVALRGVVAALFGLAVLFWPGLTLLTLVYAFAAFVLIEGGMALAAGLSRGEDGSRSWGQLALGAIALLAGMATLVWPGITALVLVYLIGAWAIAAGLVQTVDGLQLRRTAGNEWLMLVAGAVALLFGVSVLMAPGAGTLAIAFVIGAFALIYGIVQIALGFRLRSLAARARP